MGFFLDIIRDVRRSPSAWSPGSALSAGPGKGLEPQVFEDRPGDPKASPERKGAPGLSSRTSPLGAAPPQVAGSPVFPVTQAAPTHFLPETGDAFRAGYGPHSSSETGPHGSKDSGQPLRVHPSSNVASFQPPVNGVLERPGTETPLEGREADIRTEQSFPNPVPNPVVSSGPDAGPGPGVGAREIRTMTDAERSSGLEPTEGTGTGRQGGENSGIPRKRMPQDAPNFTDDAGTAERPVLTSGKSLADDPSSAPSPLENGRMDVPLADRIPPVPSERRPSGEPTGEPRVTPGAGAPGTSHVDSGPRVHIGRIDIVVLAPEAAPAPQPADFPARDLASRSYLRRL